MMFSHHLTMHPSRFTTALNGALIIAGIASGSIVAPRAEAIVIQTTQPTSSSTPEAVWGQGLTINIGASLPDALIPPIVNLDFVGFRTGDPGVGSPGRTAVRLHVYDGFALNGDGTVNAGAIGSLVAVSSNTVNLEAAAPSTDVIWFFDDPISKSATYHYILANNTTAATSTDFSNLLFSELQVANSNPYAGGQAYVQPGDEPTHDLFFRVISSFEPVPEPSALSLTVLGLLSLGPISRRRRRS